MTFRRYQPVCFSHKDRRVDGHVLGVSRKFVKVITVDGLEYKVPISLVRSNEAIGPKRDLSIEECKSLLFIPEDEIEFTFEGSTCHGYVIAANRRTATVVTADDTKFVVPYRQLSLTDWARLRPTRIKLLQETAANAVALLDQNNLFDWGFDFDRATSRAGMCRFEEKMIVLSNNFCFRSNEAEVTDTILHEIAHALVGPDHHHDTVWLKQARALGCTGFVRTAVDASRARYIKYCTKCGWMDRAQRKNSYLVCRKCSSDVEYMDFSPKAWAHVELQIETAKTSPESALGFDNTV